MSLNLTPDTVVGFALGGGGTNWGLAQELGTGKSGAGLPGLILASGGLLGWWRRRQNKKESVDG